MLKPLLLCTLSLPAFSQIYVSPGGNNANTGTKEKPVASLHRAQQLWRQQKSPAVYLRGGTYYLDSALTLTPEDNGVTIISYNGERAILSGARPLKTSWKPSTQGIFVTPVPPGIKEMDRLFINGQPQIMARYPNYDSSARRYHGTAADAISPARIKGWKHPAGTYVHALHSAEWGGYHYRITGVNAKGEAILEGGWQNNRQMGMHKEFRFVENVREELDAPQEWYFDADAHLLYYKPVKDLPDTVSYAVLHELMIMRGTMEQPVKDISIRNITFTGTARTFMLTKEPLLRSDWTIYRDGAVLFDGTEDCSVSNCKFDAVGGNAVFISNYNRKAHIDSNHIYKAGASGIAFVGNPGAVRSPSFEYNQFVPYAQLDREPGPLNDNYPAQCFAQDNLIQYTGDVEKQSAGVEISMAKEIFVIHNSIHDVPRAGINIGDGTWGGHIIDRNDVYNTVLETGDHGAFNSWGRDRYWHPDRRVMDSALKAEPILASLDAQNAVIIRNNRFRCDHGWDIDLDDGSSNYIIFNNICLNGGLKLREGFRRKVNNNIIVNNTFHPHVWFENSGDVFVHNIVTSAYKPIGIKQWGKEVDGNYFSDPAALQTAQANGTDKNSIAGPLEFINFAKGNYFLPVTNNASKVGFYNFANGDWGTRVAALKALAAPMPFPQELIIQQGKSAATITWKGATIKDIEGLGERSAAGLSNEEGAYFVKVPENSEAYKYGFRTGDVALQVEEEPVKNKSGFLNSYQGNMWKQQTKVTVFRNQRSIQVTISK